MMESHDHYDGDSNPSTDESSDSEVVVVQQSDGNAESAQVSNQIRVQVAVSLPTQGGQWGINQLIHMESVPTIALASPTEESEATDEEIEGNQSCGQNQESRAPENMREFLDNYARRIGIVQKSQATQVDGDIVDDDADWAAGPDSEAEDNFHFVDHETTSTDEESEPTDLEQLSSSDGGDADEAESPLEVESPVASPESMPHRHMPSRTCDQCLIYDVCPGCGNYLRRQVHSKRKRH